MISSQGSTFSQDLKEVMQEMESIVKRTEKFMDDIKHGRLEPQRSGAYFRSPGPAVISKHDMVLPDGGWDKLEIYMVHPELKELIILPISGMGGIGKTAFASSFYNDPSASHHFAIRAWATASDEYCQRDIMLNLLDCMKMLDEETIKKSDDQLAQFVKSSLSGKRYLVVLDDLCDINTWADLAAVFPEDHNGSRLLVTTRTESVADDIDYRRLRVRFLDESLSWTLLRRTMFGEEQCPHQLEKYGKKIAKNCEGLPLAIISVGRHLAKADKTPEYWKAVAESGNSLLNDTEDVAAMTKQLSSSYTRLDQHLKVFFVYMAVFPQKYEIYASNLINLWLAERFLESTEKAHNYLDELLDNNLILVCKSRSTRGTKMFTVHYALWLVCLRMAKKHKIFHVLDKRTDCRFPQGSKSQLRRLSIYNNVLMGIKDDYDSMKSLSSLRSFLCFGSYHQYPLLHVCLDYKLLRVLDARTIRFYEFPAKIFQLFHLRYLALTYNGGELPDGFSKLVNLQFLIVSLHVSVQVSGAPSYLPMEIWNLKELRHLQFMGRDLPDPCGKVLPNLIKLSCVSHHSCTKEVFRGIPNLRKLGIRIVLANYQDLAEPLRPFEHLVLLEKLISLNCVVVSPLRGSQAVALPDSESNFPCFLRKISLSGCGLPWDDMKKIPRKENLVVLKLRCHAFQGPSWEIKDGEFNELRCLLLEDLDLVRWRTDNDAGLRGLENLRIRHCYKLKELPQKLGGGLWWLNVELVDCDPLAANSAMQPIRYRFRTKVNASYSWEDKK